MTARDQLAGYIALQRLLDRRSALKKKRDTPPEALAALRTQFSERHDKLEAARVRRDTLQSEQGPVQGEAEALREEREHFRKQKSQVTNMKQLSAVVSELDHVETQLKAKEDRLLEIMQGIEAAEREIASLGEESPEEKALREQAEAAWNEVRATSEAELAEIERELRDVQRGLGEPAMNRFKKLWASRRPTAVVPMEGDACSACHGDLRPSLVQLVRTAEELQFCDHCRRLLFDPDQFPPPA
ncbi:MAG TPA: C4-type zinc ribbon domain-containing protein [Thermoanaerobaculaceae bacterium]|nr:C4-type zinc ribbon domain-containing protein [Thermoanaerobaculaceae bacterium]